MSNEEKSKKILRISNETTIGITMSSLVALAISVAAAAVSYDNVTDRIAGAEKGVNKNTEAIHRIEHTMRVNQAQDSLNDTKREIRELKRELRKDVTNELIVDQILQLEDEKERLESLLECYRDNPDKVCE